MDTVTTSTNFKSSFAAFIISLIELSFFPQNSESSTRFGFTINGVARSPFFNGSPYVSSMTFAPCDSNVIISCSYIIGSTPSGTLPEITTKLGLGFNERHFCISSATSCGRISGPRKFKRYSPPSSRLCIMTLTLVSLFVQTKLHAIPSLSSLPSISIPA